MKNLLFLLFFLVVFPACENGIFLFDNTYENYIGNKSVDSDINFTPIEEHNSSEVAPPTLKINFATTKQYPCINYHLLTTVTERQDELIVRFDEVNIGPICATAIGPATTSVSFPETTKYLVLINGKKIDKYAVNITKEEINLISKETSFSKLGYDRTFRYPKDSFALLCGTNVNNTRLCNDFYDLLTENTDVSEFVFEGDDKIPYPDSTSGNWRNNPSVFFTYSSFEEFDKAGDLLRNFSKNNLTENDGVSIFMSSWNNKHFRSWMFN